MTIANVQDHKFKVGYPWLCLGDRAILKTSIVSVLINDGASLSDKSVAVTFVTNGGPLIHWEFRSADQLNAVLDELGLVYHPNIESSPNE